MRKPEPDEVMVYSSNGEYLCGPFGLVRDFFLYGGSDHEPGSRVRFDWPEGTTDAIDILACGEHLADGSFIPPDEDYLRDARLTN